MEDKVEPIVYLGLDEGAGVDDLHIVGLMLPDCPAVSLDLCIYTNKYPNVKQLSWAIN